MKKQFDPKTVVLKFNDRINNRDFEGLVDLMADDHEFIDSADNRFTGKSVCQKAWNSFFNTFPDYQNVFEKLSSKGNTLVILDHSVCSDKRLEGRAIWTAKITDDKVSEWRIYLDTEENRKKLTIN